MTPATSHAACAQCGKHTEPSDLLVSPNGMICTSCHFDAESADRSKPKPTLAVAALVLGTVPFVASFRTTSSSSTSVDGIMESVETSTFDYVGVPIGVMVVILGVVAAVTSTRTKAPNLGMLVGLAVGAIALGAFQILRGLGKI